jgi:hypothetical protein
VSADSQDAFHAALLAHSQAAEQARATGQQPVPAELAASTGLITAARAHVDDSRPLAAILEEYTALQAAQAAGEPYDAQVMQVLAEELQPVRMASAILAGSYPDGPPAVSTEEGP